MNAVFRFFIRMNCSKDNTTRFLGKLIDIIFHTRIDIFSCLVESNDSKKLKIDIFEIKTIVNCILRLKYR